MINISFPAYIINVTSLSVNRFALSTLVTLQYTSSFHQRFKGYVPSTIGVTYFATV